MTIQLHHELQNSGFLVCAVDKYGATENSVKKLDLIDMESISSVIYEFRTNYFNFIRPIHKSSVKLK